MALVAVLNKNRSDLFFKELNLLSGVIRSGQCRAGQHGAQQQSQLACKDAQSVHGILTEWQEAEAGWVGGISLQLWEVTDGIHKAIDGGSVFDPGRDDRIADFPESFNL